VEEVTGESLTAPSPPSEPSKEPPRKKNPAAVALGKLGGKKGGTARRAAQACWKKSKS